MLLVSPITRLRLLLPVTVKWLVKWVRELKELDWLGLWKQQGAGYAVYKAASRSTRHFMCPVPVAVLKAIEVEAGLALPKDVSFSFKKVKSGRE